MTLPADNKSENETTAEKATDAPKADKAKAADTAKASEPDVAKADGAEASKALAPAGTSPVNPFVATPAAEEKIDTTAAAGAAMPRPFMSRMLDYSAHAAIIVGLIGFAWTVSDHVVGKPGPKSDPATPVAAAALPEKPVDEMAQMRVANQKLHDEIKALKTSVDTLRATVRHDTTPEQVRVLSAGLDSMKGTISAANASIAQLNGKIDKLQPGKLQQLTERVGRLEHQSLDPSSTGSIAKAEPRAEAAPAEVAKAAPKPPTKPATLASKDDTSPAKDADAGADKPPVLSGWVVRDVYQGVALIEGKHGTMEIVPGVNIPGAGVVKSIDRKGGGWTVTTTKGQFASAATSSQAHNDRPHGNGYGDYNGGYGGPYGHRGYSYRYGY